MLAALPEHVDHFAVDAHRGIAQTNFGNQSADGSVKGVPVWHAVAHELSEGGLGIEEADLVGLRCAQVLLEECGMLAGSDDQAGVAAAHAAADVLGDGFGEKRLVLPRLHNVVSARRVLQNFGPIHVGFLLSRKF